MAKIRRYIIEVKDVDADTTVMLTAADWDDHDKRAALAQISRLVGVPDGVAAGFLEEIVPDSEPRKG